MPYAYLRTVKYTIVQSTVPSRAVRNKTRKVRSVPVYCLVILSPVLQVGEVRGA
jgi:hypothetical protein